MSITEQKALELADRLQQDFNSEYINWDNIIETAAELRRLYAEHEVRKEELASAERVCRQVLAERDNLRSKLDDLEIKNASLESEVFHLSTLCDEQRAILVDVEMDFGTDAHGIEFEDGDYKLIDRVRDHLAMLAQPKPDAQPTEAAQKGGAA